MMSCEIFFGKDCIFQNVFDFLDREKFGEVGKLNVF